MLIRPENKNDFDAIYQLVKTAFETAEMSDGHEQDFVNTLRQTGRCVPELSLVAQRDSQLIGHIMLSKTCIHTDAGDVGALLLGPVAVPLELRKQGIGSELIRTALQKAKELGFASIFLAGNPAYYTRFGFVPAHRFNIRCSMDIPEHLLDCIMACELTPGALADTPGTVDLT
jgi:predicted N-acetyltransferase YhbS